MATRVLKLSKMSMQIRILTGISNTKLSKKHGFENVMMECIKNSETLFVLHMSNM